MVLAALALAAVVAGGHAPASATPGAQPAAPVWDEAPQDPAQVAPTRFKCQAGSDIIARFDARGPRLLMIVDAGDGPHALPITPWDGGPVRLTWSDGQRTLTWSPGVQIMWMDGAEHRMCGGGMHHEH